MLRKTVIKSARTRLAGFFARPEDLVGAARSAHDRGFEIVEAYSPYPIPGMLPGKSKGQRTHLKTMSLAGALIAMTLITWFCLWASAISWPINVGGKPWNSFPAFLPIVFEITILAAALVPSLFFLVALSLRHSPGYPEATSDQFVLVVDLRDSRDRISELAHLLRSHSALEVREEIRNRP